MVMMWSLILSGAVIGGSVTFALMFGWKYYTNFSWPIQIPVMIRRGARGIVWDLNERGKYMKSSDGKRAIRLRKAKVNIKAPNYDFVNVDKKGGPVYPVVNYGAGKYGSVDIDVTNPNIEIADDLDTNWAIQELRENVLRYMPKEDWKQLLIKYVAPIAFLASMVFFWIYFGGKLEIMTNSLSGAATQLALAMERFASAPPPLPAG